jgi:hypothetical protein
LGLDTASTVSPGYSPFKPGCRFAHISFFRRKPQLAHLAPSVSLKAHHCPLAPVPKCNRLPLTPACRLPAHTLLHSGCGGNLALDLGKLLSLWPLREMEITSPRVRAEGNNVCRPKPCQFSHPKAEGSLFSALCSRLNIPSPGSGTCSGTHPNQKLSSCLLIRLSLPLWLSQGQGPTSSLYMAASCPGLHCGSQIPESAGRQESQS